MHYNTHSNDLTENEISYQKLFNNVSSTETRSKTETKPNRLSATLSPEIKKEEKTAFPRQNKASDVEKSTSATTTTNSTGSTDSGVNISDNGDISPPSPKYSQSHSLATNSTVNHCYEKFHKHNENINRDNNVNNNEGNNCKNVINSNISNNVDHNDENENFSSRDFDNKFKVSESSEEGNSARFPDFETQNLTYNTNAINICQQRNLGTVSPTKASTANPIAITSKQYNDKTSLQYNEFIHPPEHFPSTTSLLSNSVTENNYDNNLPSKNMHHCKDSPIVSIRSINSTIITSDSDSDLDSDAENYVIKKLGTQVVYSPNDPAIPNISSGHAVINQSVIANSNEAPLPPLQALAVIGDRIGAAQALGPVSSLSNGVQRPQIGSIALSNSSDVTFGDKHFYEGPVTIQQFLIDSRDKWKQANGKENPSFSSENVESPTNSAKNTSPEAEKSNTVYEYILERKRTIIPAILALTTLFVVATIWGSKMLTESKNPNINHNSDGCEGNGTLCLIDRDVWRAHPPTGLLVKQKIPVHRVVISHTASEACYSIQICAHRVRVIQEFHMNSMKWDDIAYNFLVSSDGRVYVGRGWDYVGAHTKGYNYDSVGITFIGTYISIEPTDVQLNACLSLLEEGVRLKKLAPDYHLYGARQLGATESPGEMLYKRIKKWNHWSANITLT